MAVRRRYLRLEERCAGTEIPFMMCRVVEDPLLPLYSYRPRDAVSTIERSRSTTDIIPELLPVPKMTVHYRDTVSVGEGKSFGTGLWPFFETELSRHNAFYEQIDAVEVNTYSLKNPASYFEELMDDSEYAASVAELLSTSKKGVIYLVTGFMTGRGLRRTQGDSKSQRIYVKLTVPVSAAYAPGLGMGDPSFSVSKDNGSGNTHMSYTPDEEIFAVSYCTIKQPRKLGGIGKRDEKAPPRFTAPRFATRSEAAYAPGDYDEDEDLVAGFTFEEMSESDQLEESDENKDLTWLPTA